MVMGKGTEMECSRRDEKETWGLYTEINWPFGLEWNGTKL